MAKIILSVNAGSSSVKISVYSVAQASRVPQQIAETQIDGLTAPPPQLKYIRGSEPIAKGKQIAQKIETQDEAFRFLLDNLISDDALDGISKKEDISHACHRVVHGGDYAAPQIITKETYHHLETLTALAPLHNASALAIIRSCMGALPHSTNIAFFDTQFHHSIPAHIYTYAISPAVAGPKRLRKYGFHGLSYAFITRSVAAFLDRPIASTSLIALHLGSGASVCAIAGGASLDTSMGLTPLAGLPGATRSGDVDPSLVFHYADHVGALQPSAASTSTSDKANDTSPPSLHITRAETILNQQAGWKSLTGTTDFSHIASSSEPAMQQALDLFVDRICGYVGGYFVSLRGRVDALVFAGGIGERSAILRERVVERCKCLGLAGIDQRKNEGAGEGVVWDVGRESDGRWRVLVCRTDEQLEMARGCAADEKLFAS